MAHPHKALLCAQSRALYDELNILRSTSHQASLGVSHTATLPHFSPGPSCCPVTPKPTKVTKDAKHALCQHKGWRCWDKTWGSYCRDRSGGAEVSKEEHKALMGAEEVRGSRCAAPAPLPGQRLQTLRHQGRCRPLLACMHGCTARAQLQACCSLHAGNDHTGIVRKALALEELWRCGGHRAQAGRDGGCRGRLGRLHINLTTSSTYCADRVPHHRQQAQPDCVSSHALTW